MSNTMQLRTSSSKPSAVDVANRTISGVVVMELGKIQDYRAYNLDQEFATALLNSAKKQKKGVMSNFGHNYDNLGKRLGRMSNFTQEGSKIIADLEVFEAADKSPGYPGMGAYVLEMAQEDAEAIMLSINFSYKYQFQKMKDGTEFKVNYYDRENYNYVYPNPELGDIYLKFDELASVDAVDKGAATNSFFSDKGELLAAAHEVFSHEDFAGVFSELPAELQKKIKKPGVIAELKALFTGLMSESKDDTALLTKEISEMENTQLDALNKQIEDLTAERDALAAGKQSAEDANTALLAKVSSLTDSVTAALSRIDALEKKPAASHTTGDEEDEGSSELKKVIDPTTERALAQFKRNKK